MAIGWKYFLGRRRLTLEDFVRVREIRSYDHLVSHLSSLGVAPPAREDAHNLFLSRIENTETAPPAIAQQELQISLDVSSPELLSEESSISTEINHDARSLSATGVTRRQKKKERSTQTTASSDIEKS